MGFLDSEAEGKISGMLDEAIGSADAPDTPRAEEIEVKTKEEVTEQLEQKSDEAKADTSPSEEKVEAAPSEVTADVKEPATKGEAKEAPSEPKAADSSASDDDVPSGHRVPYNRFKSVIEARNQFQSEADGLKAQIEELKKQVDSSRASQQATPAPQKEVSDDAWLDELLGKTPEADSGSSVKSLEKRLFDTEVALARQDLEREIVAAREKYPNVDRDVILHAVSTNPSLSAEQAAERYSTWVNGVEEAAIARYLKDNPGAVAEATEGATKKAAPPRPKPVGATGSSIAKDDPPPRTVKEGTSALRRFMEENNPFA